MKKYLAIITGDIEDEDYQTSVLEFDEKELKTFKESLTSFCHIMKSYSLTHDTYTVETKQIPVYEKACNTVCYPNYYGNDKQWYDTLDSKDIERFKIFINKYLPIFDGQFPHTIIDIKVAEINKYLEI